MWLCPCFDTSQFGATENASQTWYVFDRRVVDVATVPTPGRFLAHHVGDNYVLGRSSNNLGVERISLYELHKY
jgi:hypothetical protein